MGPAGRRRRGAPSPGVGAWRRAGIPPPPSPRRGARAPSPAPCRARRFSYRLSYRLSYQQSASRREPRFASSSRENERRLATTDPPASPASRRRRIRRRTRRFPTRADGASPVLGSPRARAARKLRGRGRDREVPRRVRDRTGRRGRLVRAAPRRDAADAGALPGHVRDVRSSRPTRCARARARARRDARARRRRQAVRRAHRRRRRHPRRSSTARALADPATSPIDPAFPLTQARGDVNQKHPRRPIGPATRPSARRTPACAARPAGVRRGRRTRAACIVAPFPGSRRRSECRTDRARPARFAPRARCQQPRAARRISERYFVPDRIAEKDFNSGRT